MPFDANKFDSARFSDRTSTVEVSTMAQFFDDGEDAVFVVRGLTGHELGIVNEAEQRAKATDAVIESLASDNASEKINAIREALGLSDDNVPSDVVRRQEMLCFGCVEPALTHEQAVKLCAAYPYEFYKLTNEIITLTGQGKTLGKP